MIKKNIRELFFRNAGAGKRRRRTGPAIVNAVLLAGLVGIAHPYCFAQSCHPIETRPVGSGFRGRVVPIGKYCLNIDLKQFKEFDIHAGRFLTYEGVPLLNILYPSPGRTPDFSTGEITEIDLQGHELIAEPDDMTGILDRIPSEHLYVHNGTIHVPGTDEHNIGIDLQAMSSPRETYARPNCKASQTTCMDGPSVHQKAPPYRRTEHVVEKVNVRAGHLGVQMVGIGNTLRDSVIEVDSRGAIALFGPGSKIENNTIIVHGKGDATSDDGAIVLWDGNGAVIRNNRFIFKGWFKKAPPAIRLIDSADVRLEGNTFEGFDQRVEQVGASSYRINP
ncbi:hypothetical protein HAV22_12740 [Massilia sp. TW-1]|uniref:Right handed beta helix domain-containing protein n=1 Tax=Telluria antibiotica TaxID=2717319 RepID=A0ABX0PAY9_9BURK|nr:right-handed parallel beta-helix repeat-containing protein [Telluria antibiotica]NIA54502.1 hypothetical protein [Telluria antibiotica]